MSQSTPALKAADSRFPFQTIPSMPDPSTQINGSGSTASTSVNSLGARKIWKFSSHCWAKNDLPERFRLHEGVTGSRSARVALLFRRLKLWHLEPLKLPVPEWVLHSCQHPSFKSSTVTSWFISGRSKASSIRFARTTLAPMKYCLDNREHLWIAFTNLLLCFDLDDSKSANLSQDCSISW